MDFVLDLPQMGWQDYLDIIVVAFLIYQLLPLIRTPNIMRIAKTVGILVLMTWVTEEAGIHTLNWLLDQLLAIGLLAFVVLFQPELRKMLDHIGSVRLSSLFSTSKPMQEMEHVIHQTVRACEIMGNEKVGALIVFSKDTKLDEHFKTGTLIDAQVTDPLLRNIFFHNSPLHDGAVIIQNGRIAAAGCMLPLSHNPMIPKSLGTRHHAAVGMSEASDALVVVVSEETGAISVAEGGILKRHLAPETLEKLLRSKLCPEADTGEQGSSASRVFKKIAGKGKEDGYGK